MKFDYKKVVSVVASAVMLSSTIGFAAASTYPTPFSSDAAVVYGANAANTDGTAAIDIYTQLKNLAGGSTTTGTITGESKAIETASQKLYLGDQMNGTKATLSKDDLPSVLASGTLNGADGKEYKYDLKIGTPNAEVIYGETPDNLATPVVYADFDSSSQFYTLKLIFPTAVDPSNLTDEGIVLFGKNYVFSGTASELTNSQIVLYEKSTPVIVNDGESVTAEGHTISVAVEDATKAAITIDGTTATKDEGWSGRIGGVDLYLKNVVGPNVAGTSRYVELYLNSNKLTLSDGDEVTLGSDTVDGTLVTFVSNGAKVSEIDIKETPYSFNDEVKYMKQGDKFSDPVFKTIKFQLASVTPDLQADTRDYIMVKPSGEKKASLEFTNKAGSQYSLDVLKPSNIRLTSAYVDSGWNGTADTVGTYTYNATTLGVGDYDLITTAAGTVNEDDYFITCSNEYTQIWQVKNIKPSSGEVKLQDVGSGTSSVTLSISANNDSTASLSLADGSTATITLASNVTGSTAITADKACSYLYTEKGAKIDLTNANAPTSNLSEIRVSQDTAYNGGDFKDNTGATLGSKNVTVRFSYDKAGRSGKDLFIRDTLSGPTDGTLNTDFWSQSVGDYDYYYITKYGTFVKQTGDTDKEVEVYYPEDAMSVGFYIGEDSSQMSTVNDTSSPISIVKDTEISSVESKNLIVVGGSCVNAAAAKILGSDSPVCGDDFSAQTQVGPGGYIIKVVQSPYNSEKIAMLVAGYNAADTQTAVKRAMVIGGVKTDIDSTETYPVVA